MRKPKIIDRQNSSKEQYMFEINKMLDNCWDHQLVDFIYIFLYKQLYGDK